MQSWTINPGDYRVVSLTLPWSDFSSKRGMSFVAVVDAGFLDTAKLTVGSTLSSDSYRAAVYATNLTARSTRAFSICK